MHSLADLKAVRDDIRADLIQLQKAQEQVSESIRELEEKYVLVAKAYQEGAQALLVRLKDELPQATEENAPEPVVEGLA